MLWDERFGRDTQPDFSQISAYIGSPLWTGFCAYLEQVYGVLPRIEHSRCSGAPGWNVKYKKSSHSLCTLYPNEGFFTCLVIVGDKDAMEAELLLNTCTEHIRELYLKAKPMNGSRWLMVDVKSADILEDVKKLIGLRTKQK